MDGVNYDIPIRCYVVFGVQVLHWFIMDCGVAVGVDGIKHNDTAICITSGIFSHLITLEVT